MTLPFPKTPCHLSDEDLTALDDYYCDPYYARDAKKVRKVKEHVEAQRLTRETERDKSGIEA